MLAELISRSPTFGSLPQQHLQQLMPHFTRLEYQPGTTIVAQGGPGDAMFLIESGTVGVSTEDARLGMLHKVATLEAPEAFGEMALVTGEARSASCEAIGATVVHRLGKDVFDAIVQQTPGLALGIARSLATRLSQITKAREIPWMSLTERQLDRRLWALAPEQILRGNRLAPISLDGRTLTVGMVDPRDGAALNALRQAIPGMTLEVVAVSHDDYERFVAQRHQASTQSAQADVPAGQRPHVVFADPTESRANPSAQAVAGTQVVELADEIVGTGLALGASDIHIEHERQGIGVRYRVEGSLRSRTQPIPSEMGRALLSRIKLLSGMDITDTRHPQDGRMTVQAGQRVIDLRVSTIPAKLGEKVVLRILDAEANVTDLKSLFVVDGVRQLYAELVFRPHGLVMATGPTGSGKTTTLYSSLMARRRPELNLVTVEDPIEYHLDGITQVQVQAEIGTTFAAVLRALLRQDPDVVLVGETRDAETAKMAVEASMTGHLVMTSVHSNSAVDAVVRLGELDVERYAVANSLLGVLHQRLVRRMCPSCAEPFEYPKPIVDRLYRVGAFRQKDRPVLKHGKGCERCGGTGYKGRLALYELLGVNDQVRAAISAGADAPTIARAAGSGALLPLARYAGVAVGQGHTTPGEVLHLLQQVGA